MANLIGHNNPPKDRKINYKSISINKWTYAELVEIKEHIQKLRDIHNPEMKLERVTIPMAIEILSNQYKLNNIILPELDKKECGIKKNSRLWKLAI